jgi:steroid delta-isomerase-like uncharacterized protein
MSRESLDHILRELGRCLNHHDLGGLKALYAPDYEGSDVGCESEHRGPSGVGDCFARYWRAFPDLRLAATERIVQGNRVAVSWYAQGTHEGTFMNIPATGRRVTLRGVSFLTLDGGRVSRATHTWDVAGFLRAVRLLPDL